MNNSTHEPIPALRDECTIPDALIDEVEDTMTRLARLMSSRHVGPECCPDSISLTQAMLMRALDAHGTMKMSDIASLLAVKPPAASATIDALERAGYLERAHDDEDRRVILVCLTPEGRETLARAELARRAAMRSYLSLLSEDDVRAMIRIHHRLIDAIDAGLV